MTALPTGLAEIVLALADLAEDIGGRAVGKAESGGERRVVGPEEGIGRALLAHGRGDRRLRPGTQLCDLALAPAQRRVAGIHGDGEAGVGGGVFMAAVDAGLGR